MSRAKWKFKYLSRNNNDFSKQIIWNRDLIITSKALNKTLKIYNGKTHNKIFVTKQKLGYKVGEFCSTRKFKKKDKK